MKFNSARWKLIIHILIIHINIQEKDRSKFCIHGITVSKHLILQLARLKKLDCKKEQFNEIVNSNDETQILHSLKFFLKSKIFVYTIGREETFLRMTTLRRISVIQLLPHSFVRVKLEQWNERRDNDIGYQIRSKELYYTALWIGSPREK